MLAWQLYRNLENSLKDFLDTEVNNDSVTDIDGTLIPVRTGRKKDNKWTLPCIIVYMESETKTPFEIGSILKDARQLLIIDIYATKSGERMDVAKWLSDKIETGWRYYSYTANVNTPESPDKVAGGWVSVDFLSNAKVNLGINTDEIDAHRQKISINVRIQ